MARKKKNLFDLKVRFNDIVMRELGLDITEDDNNYLYNIDGDFILQIKGKFIKYFYEDYIILKHNEMEFNVLENPRLMEMIILPFISNYCDRKNVTFQSMSQVPTNENDKGRFIVSYIEMNDKGERIIHDISSDAYINESVRIFNLICKINKTTNLYNFNEFDDIKIERKR